MNDQYVWSAIRILFTIGLMLFLHLMTIDINPRIALFLDLLLIMLFDPLDSIPLRIKYGTDYGETSRYQVSDKIGDIFLEFVALELYLWNSIIEGSTFDTILVGLFLYRLVGIILYSLFKKDIILVLFPNFFLENVMLYILLSDILHLDRDLVSTLVAISIPLKVAYEYVHHILYSKVKDE